MKDNNVKSNVKASMILKLIAKILWWVVFVLLVILLCNIFSAKIKGEVPRVFGRSIVKIITPSMEDTIPSDTYILIKKVDPEDIREGDIITFFSDDNSIKGYLNTHRVEKVLNTSNGIEFKTKGDSNIVADSVTAKADKVVGVYVRNLNGLTRFTEFLSSNGIIVLLCMFVSAVAIMMISIIIVKSVDKKKEENSSCTSENDIHSDDYEKELKEKFVKEFIENNKDFSIGTNTEKTITLSDDISVKNIKTTYDKASGKIKGTQKNK